MKYLEINWPNGDREVVILTWENYIVAKNLESKGSLVYFIMDEPKLNGRFDLKQNEKNLIIKALKMTEYNQKKAAKILGISERNLSDKINRVHGIKTPHNYTK